MRIVDLVQGTDPWHAWRESGLPASETSALFDASPYATKREMWLTRKKRIPAWFIDQEDKSYIFERGHAFEEKMRAEYFAMTGEEFTPLCVEDDEYSFIIASLDGLFHFKNPDGSSGYKIFEAKLVGKEIKERIAREGVKGIPRNHWIQVQQQLRITKAVCCVYFAYDLEDSAVVIDIYPDEAFQLTLVETLIAFKKSLDNNEEPPMSNDDFHFSENTADFEELIKLKNAKDEQAASLEIADAAYKKKMEEIISKAPHHHVASVQYAIKIKTMTKQGTIKYSEIPEVKNLSPQYLEAFRGAASTFFQAWFKKQKAAA